MRFINWGLKTNLTVSETIVPCLHEATNILHESRGRTRDHAKSPNKLPLRRHVLDKKVFRESPNLYLPLARTQIIYFSLVVTQQRGLASPLFRRPTTNAPSSNRYVFSVARLVHGIASWPGFPVGPKERNLANFDNHSKFLAHQPHVEFWNIKECHGRIECPLLMDS